MVASTCWSLPWGSSLWGCFGGAAAPKRPCGCFCEPASVGYINMPPLPPPPPPSPAFAGQHPCQHRAWDMAWIHSLWFSPGWPDGTVCVGPGQGGSVLPHFLSPHKRSWSVCLDLLLCVLMFTRWARPVCCLPPRDPQANYPHHQSLRAASHVSQGKGAVTVVCPTTYDHVCVECCVELQNFIVRPPSTLPWACRPFPTSPSKSPTSPRQTFCLSSQPPTFSLRQRWRAVARCWCTGEDTGWLPFSLWAWSSNARAPRRVHLHLAAAPAPVLSPPPHMLTALLSFQALAPLWGLTAPADGVRDSCGGVP